ncbi:MAG: hypothetical protein MZV70_60510 [Desulfobacterales bacterium]|nr:hypothetical protein [Desulfobacterales bacterium]
MSSMELGNIVEYIDRERILCAVVLEISNQRLRLLTENNTRSQPVRQPAAAPGQQRAWTSSHGPHRGWWTPSRRSPTSARR